jgi:hypothetical protein
MSDVRRLEESGASEFGFGIGDGLGGQFPFETPYARTQVIPE